MEPIDKLVIWLEAEKKKYEELIVMNQDNPAACAVHQAYLDQVESTLKEVKRLGEQL